MMGPNIHFQLAGEAARVLNLLGIDNAALHRHIHCPLPEHEDSHPSFRVDEKRNRYFCTCNPKGGSLVDLVIAMQKASDFKEAVSYLRSRLRLNGSGASRPSPVRPQVTGPASGTAATLAVTSNVSSQKQNIPSGINEFDEYLKRCVPAHQHPYCRAKKIAPVGALYDRNTGDLVLPLLDVNRVTTGIQLISPNGQKMFVKGSRLRGSGLLLGTIENGAPLGICEGWATGVTLFSLLNQPMLVTFSANNLLAAAQPYRRLGLQMVIFGDRDSSGVGQRSAIEAAQALRAATLFPPEHEGDCDFNDLYVRKLLAKQKSF